VPVLRALAVSSIAMVAACSHYPRADSVAVGDASAQVRDRLGAPGVERRLASGDTAWYYLTGPAGFETWRVVIGPTGTVTGYAQVLTAENFDWMRSGATREQVLDRVGPPMQRMDFAATATEAWSYRWRFGTLEMIGEPVFSAATGEVRYVGVFRDPAYSSVGSAQR
jgi:outer membrane protein assembly factor BamE (lipoprotein component of BamABCDE complex)